MGKRLTAERRNELAKIVINDGTVRVGELAERFCVSTETIRKDLISLEKAGVLIKSHGGAVVSGSYYDQPIRVKMTKNRELKQAIAHRIIDILPENATIYLGIGSIPSMLAQLLSKKSGYTIVTGSFSVAYNLLESDNTIMFLGGKVNGISSSTEGGWSIDCLRNIHMDYAILSTSGLKGLSGPSCQVYEEMANGKEVVRRSSFCLLACDASKFDNSGLYQYAEWSDIDLLVTNKTSDTTDISSKVNITYV